MDITEARFLHIMQLSFLLLQPTVTKHWSIHWLL